MDVLHSRVGSVHLIQLRGRLDALSVERLSAELMPLTEQPSHRIVVALGELQSITSIGLRLMLQVARESRLRGGAFVLCELQGFVLEVFETSGFLDILPIEPGRDEAIERMIAPRSGG